MAEPIDSAWILEDADELFREQYMGEYDEQYNRMGLITNKLVRFSNDILGGNGETMQTEIAAGDVVRPSNDPLSAIAAPDLFEASTIKARFSESDSSTNDFTRFSASCQTSDITTRNGARGAAVNLAERMYQQINGEYEEKLAIFRNVGRNPILALVSGTPKQNDRIYHSGCASTPTNTTGVRFPIDNGSIGYFRRGTRIDIKAPSGAYRVQNARVTDVNTSDLSIGVEFVTATTNPVRTSSGNLANVADNDEIYFSGTYNTGYYGFGAWFGRPAASGDSFIGGRDRNAKGYRWLCPVVTREGSSSATITKSMFDDQATAMQFRNEREYGVVITSSLGVHQKIRSELGEASFFQLQAGDDRMKRFAHFGNIGLNYQHPAFGVVQITADPLHPDNMVRIVTPETWRAFFYAFRGLQAIPGQRGSWYRTTDVTPNTGNGLIWKSDWYSLQLDFCKNPQMNGAILNVAS